MLRTIFGASLLVIGLSFQAAQPAVAKPICYSAQDCGGKVLSNRDCHNCKVKSTGKSWRSGPGAACSAVKNC
jgi:hypothetical protein